MKRAKTVVLNPSHWHVPLYADTIAARHDVVGVSEASPEIGAHYAEKWDAPLYTDWRELLAEHRDAELAYVFVPHHLMRDACLAAIELGIPLVVEKPAGVSLREVAEIREAAEAAGVPVAVPLVQRGAAIEQWLNLAGDGIYESAQFVAGPPGRYLDNGSPWMLDLEQAGGGCMANLAPHFVDLFLRSTGATDVTVTSALSSRLHRGDVEDYASLTMRTLDGRIGTVEVGYAFPDSPLKRHCSFMRTGERGTSTIWSDGTASFTSAAGVTQATRIDVDSDGLYGPFVDAVADQLDHGFPALAGIRDLEATMAVIWEAYAGATRGGVGVHTEY